MAGVGRSALAEPFPRQEQFWIATSVKQCWTFQSSFPIVDCRHFVPILLLVTKPLLGSTTTAAEHLVLTRNLNYNMAKVDSLINRTWNRDLLVKTVGCFLWHCSFARSPVSDENSHHALLFFKKRQWRSWSRFCKTPTTFDQITVKNELVVKKMCL